MHSVMYKVARLMAVLGGVVLVALVIITCVSVLGLDFCSPGHKRFAVRAPGSPKHNDSRFSIEHARKRHAVAGDQIRARPSRSYVALVYGKAWCGEYKK